MPRFIWQNSSGSWIAAIRIPRRWALVLRYRKAALMRFQPAGTPRLYFRFEREEA